MRNLADIKLRTEGWIAPAATLEDVLLQHDIEQCLYHEAALLDARRFEDWYALLADDLEYWMPARSTRSSEDMDEEFAKPGEGALFDDTKQHMAERIRKLFTGFAWAEDPPSRTRHLVNNVRILEKTQSEGHLEVKIECGFLIYRSRLARDVDLWVGRREDWLRKADGDGAWLIAKRHIFIDQVSLSSQNLSVFF
jgi:3-phenylpropionate/cinnamic acid dioxygenase small subunit